MRGCHGYVLAWGPGSYRQFRQAIKRAEGEAEVILLTRIAEAGGFSDMPGCVASLWGCGT
jgi:hypothetical protein